MDCPWCLLAQLKNLESTGYEYVTEAELGNPTYHSIPDFDFHRWKRHRGLKGHWRHCIRGDDLRSINPVTLKEYQQICQQAEYLLKAERGFE